jgi:hypothetical protein
MSYWLYFSLASLNLTTVGQCLAISALFQPWSDMKSSPLKPLHTPWQDALNNLKASMSSEHARIVANMHLLYQTRDAKFDFATKRRQRLAELKMMAKDKGIDTDAAREEYDPVWENAM